MAEFKSVNELNSLDSFFSSSDHGSIAKAYGNTLYGINHNNVKPIIPRDNGYVERIFFVRPQLNMKATNCRYDRHTTNLLTNEVNSIQNYIRHMLDPRLYDINLKDKILEEALSPPSFLDPKNPFIPLLTNTIKNCSGFPDRTMPTFSTPSGIMGEQYSMPDGIFEYFGEVEIDCTFDRIINNPVEKLLSVWIKVIELQIRGLMVPYLEEDVDKTRNYDTRIYRLNLESTGNIVTSIASTGPLYPIVDNIGKEFDYEGGNERDRGNTVNFRFKGVCAMYNDPILIREFNDCSAQFNKDLKDMLDYRNLAIQTRSNKYLELVATPTVYKIPRFLKRYCNNVAYPIINESTMELEWWISLDSPTYSAIESAGYGIDSSLKGKWVNIDTQENAHIIKYGSKTL